MAMAGTKLFPFVLPLTNYGKASLERTQVDSRGLKWRLDGIGASCCFPGTWRRYSAEWRLSCLKQYTAANEYKLNHPYVKIEVY
jgi:hypothetical protein